MVEVALALALAALVIGIAAKRLDDHLAARRARKAINRRLND